MFLASTTETLTITVTGTLSGANPSFVVGYADFNFANGTTTPGTYVGTVSSNDETLLLPAPAVGVTRQPKTINVVNGDAPLTFTVAYKVATVDYPVYITNESASATFTWGYETGWSPSMGVTSNVPSPISEFDYAGGTNLVYVGNAAPGSSTGAEVWQIAKLSYDIYGNLASRLYAAGSANFAYSWDARTSYTYG